MKLRKKGFTITELVIVIVVIAILAAVLIPTFSSLIKKANISADTQLAKNLNTVLSMTEATDGKPTDFAQVLEAFRENGFLLANINPTTDGCYMVWESETNQILLVELTEDGHKVLFSAKDGAGDPDESWYIAVSSQADADAVKAVLPNVTVNMTILSTTELNTQINADGDNTLYIDGSITVDDNNTIKLDNAEANVTIELGTSAVTGGSNDTTKEAIPFEAVAGTLNLVGGNINAFGAFIDSDNKVMNSVARATNGSVMNIEGTKVKLDEAAATLFSYTGATGTLKDIVIDAKNSNNAINVSDGEVRVENANVDVQYIAIHATYGAEVTVVGGTYHASLSNLLCVNANASTITVEGGTFSCDVPAKTFKFYNYTGNKIVLKGGTFNGVAFENLTKTQLEGWCNLSDCTKGVTVENVNGAWVITVK